MSLQPLELQPSQGNAIRTLGNMAHAVDASEARLQLSNNEIVQTLSSTLQHSENNSRLLSEENARLNGRVTQLEQTLTQLVSARQAEQLAAEERFRALTAKMDALARQLNEKTNETETKFDALQKLYNGHTHNYYISAGLNRHQWIGTSGPNG